MGLDVLIAVTPVDLLYALRDLLPGLDDPQAKRVLADIQHVERITDGETMVHPIHVLPGSYGGAHRVRVMYAMLKGWAVDGRGHVLMEGDCPARKSHLCNHSDCEGYYIPSDFETPIWHEGESIGSSQKLLAELREIESVRSDDPMAWDALYLAALASCTCREVIHFQ